VAVPLDPYLLRTGPGRVVSWITNIEIMAAAFFIIVLVLLVIIAICLVLIVRGERRG
jgi:hypothetical protein